MKKEFHRTDGLFSLCGLNCGLCPMQIQGECSGCFNGSTCYQTPHVQNYHRFYWWF